jgi:hypothetical protein
MLGDGNSILDTGGILRVAEESWCLSIVAGNPHF